MSTSAPTTPKRGAISVSGSLSLCLILYIAKNGIPANAVGQIRGEPTDPLRTVYLGVGETTQLP